MAGKSKYKAVICGARGANRTFSEAPAIVRATAGTKWNATANSKGEKRAGALVEGHSPKINARESSLFAAGKNSTAALPH